ncbi:MAG TPA: HNH endonuclease signature motif containing protein [Candidatus Krumholzibacteria bacterium]|nr:HNH endonuclease signature motif containing protein [Candidatus Krumholzibacteria bacterium]
MPVSLRSLSDPEILSRTAALVARERALTLDVLLHLNEVERRALHLKCGHSSMFAYCTDALGYSASAASRRIRTARCIARFPEVFSLLECNEVNLSTISQVSRILTPDNHHAVLTRIRGKSQREVDAIVAEYDPRATVPPDRVRTVMVPVRPAYATVATRPVAPTHTNEYDRSGGQELASFASRQDPGDGAATTTKPADVAHDTVRLERRAVVQFTASETVMTKLERVRAIASHRLPANAPLEQLLEFLADHFIEREDPRVRHERRMEKSQSRNREHVQREKPAAASARSIPVRVRDEVFARDGAQCTFVGPDGRRCRSDHVLQIDHIQPVARGGGGSITNLRLLCAHHNRLEAQRLMGCVGPPGGQRRN